MPTWWTKHRSIPILLLVLVGFAGGLLFQKYFTVGRVLEATGIRPGPTQTPPPGINRGTGTEVPISSLPQNRVMVALVFGQSNAASYGETPLAANEGVYTFYNDTLYRASDPLLGTEGNGGSVWTRLGNRIIAAKLYDAVVFAPATVGGTEIARWKPDGDLHSSLIDAIRELKNRKLTVTHLLWHQGEADAHKTSKAEYMTMFLDMLASIRKAGVDAPIYVSVASRCQKNRGDVEIEQAQKDLVDRTSGIYPGPYTDELGFAYRYDGCHFTDEGLEQFAELWLRAITKQ